MKIACVVIWYNPEKLGPNTAIQNILNYSEYFGHIFIIDNSNNNNNDLAVQIPNSVYIPNFKNLGIARALNQGCEKAMESGYDWVMTMDHDSNWNKENLLLYLSESEKLALIDEKNVSFSPLLIGNKRSILSDIIHKIIKENKSKSNAMYQFVDRVITSGNILKLAIWKLLDGFNVSLFIDEVDHEFCYRLRERGYKIIEIHTCSMFHNLGTNKRYFFPHPCQHQGVRIYYIVRNMLFVKKNYYIYFIKFNYQQFLFSIMVEILFFHFSDYKYFYRGMKDGYNNILGKYCYNK